MLSCVMVCQNRPRLLDQTLDSLRQNTSGPWNLTIVDDGSGSTTAQLLGEWTKLDDRIRVLRNEKVVGPGDARNLGVKASETEWGRGDWLYFCDSDCYFLPGWDEILLAAWPTAEEFGFKALGAYCHPYNRTNAKLNSAGVEIHEKYCLGFLSCLMKWETWDKHGPLDPAPTANASDDWKFSQRIRESGRVGCVWPWVVINTGLTGSDGRLSPGSELLYNQAIPEGVIIE